MGNKIWVSFWTPKKGRRFGRLISEFRMNLANTKDLIPYICGVRAADLFKLHNLITITSEALSKNRPHPDPDSYRDGTSHKTQDNSGSLRFSGSSNLVSTEVCNTLRPGLF